MNANCVIVNANIETNSRRGSSPLARQADRLAAMRALNKALSVCLSLLALSCAWAQTNVDFTRTEDVLYGRKFGTALTLDMFQPSQTNGVGIILVVSGGWFSSHEAINADLCRPLLNRGYTVFAVVHGSQPKFTTPEIVTDMQRAVRFIRNGIRTTRSTSESAVAAPVT